MDREEGSRDAGGTAAEITKLIIQNRTVLFGYTMAQTGDYDVAEDIFQDVCAKICEKFHEFRKGTSFRAWAFTIARYVLLGHYQRRSRRRQVQLTPELAESLADSAASIEAERPFAEELAALRKCLGKVKGKNRALLLKRYGERLSPRSISQLIGWTPNAVYVALSRLRGALERCIRSQMAARGGA